MQILLNFRIFDTMNYSIEPLWKRCTFLWKCGSLNKKEMWLFSFSMTIRSLEMEIFTLHCLPCTLSCFFHNDFFSLHSSLNKHLVLFNFFNRKYNTSGNYYFFIIYRTTTVRAPSSISTPSRIDRTLSARLTRPY